MTTPKFGLAQPVRRVEDPRLLVGRGRYTDDIVLPNMLHGVLLRSPHAAARIKGIDAAAASSLPGVKAIYTAADLNADGIGPLPCAAPVENRDGTPQAMPPHPVLADDMVRHVGDPVAFVVADSAKAARDAAEQVTVGYETLPSVTDTAKAMDKGAPLVWPDVPHNLAFDWEIGDKAATEAQFAKAAHVTRLTVVNNRIVVSSMEARVAMADFDAATGRWTLYANTQGGWLVKNLMAPLFNADPEKFRIVTPDVGGGFGMKLFLYAEHVLTCYAARRLGRPVKWVSDRSEAFVADTQGRDNVTLGEVAMDAGGKFLALRTRNVSNMGAYLSNFAPFIPDLRRHQRAGQHLRLPGGVCQRAGRVHAHRAGRCVSWRRTAGGELSGGTPGGRRRARSEDRPRRIAAPQHGAAQRHAVRDAGRQVV